MVAVAPGTDWVRQAAALTAEPFGDWAVTEPAAAAVVARLSLAARAVRAAPDEGGTCRCGADPCRFDFLAPEGAILACELAADLAAASPHMPAAVPDAVRSTAPGDAARWFVAALHDVGVAVHHCRTVRHRAGSCWFAPEDPASNLCGRVLALAHRLDVG